MTYLAAIACAAPPLVLIGFFLGYIAAKRDQDEVQHNPQELRQGACL